MYMLFSGHVIFPELYTRDSKGTEGHQLPLEGGSIPGVCLVDSVIGRSCQCLVGGARMLDVLQHVGQSYKDLPPAPT